MLLVIIISPNAPYQFTSSTTGRQRHHRRPPQRPRHGRRIQHDTLQRPPIPQQSPNDLPLLPLRRHIQQSRRLHLHHSPIHTGRHPHGTLQTTPRTNRNRSSNTPFAPNKHERLPTHANQNATGIKQNPSPRNPRTGKINLQTRTLPLILLRYPNRKYLSHPHIGRRHQSQFKRLFPTHLPSHFHPLPRRRLWS